MKKSTVEGHGKALRIEVNPILFIMGSHHDKIALERKQKNILDIIQGVD